MGARGGADHEALIVSRDKQNKNLQSRQLIYDYERGEIIDLETGEVVGQIYDYIPNIRASDYAEWERKIHHSPLMELRDRRDREIYSLTQAVGDQLKAPEWLKEDVLQFLLKIRRKKSTIQSALTRRRQGAIKLHDWKFVLAAYYVIARKRGLYDLADRIAKTKCEDEVVCYKSKKLKDAQFFRFMVVLEDIYRLLNSESNSESDNTTKEIEEMIRLFCTRLSLPITVLGKAIRKSKGLVEYLQGRRPRNIAAVSVLLSVAELYGDEKMLQVKKEMVKELGVPESSLRNILRKFVPVIFYVPS
jgi:Transcription initiation factor TFIIIB, Brf1 subunit/Transcription initiation factor TFIIB